MINIGIQVRVLYPLYASGLEGIIEAKEKNGRWIVHLRNNPFINEQKPFLLSLDESDFEKILD